MAHQPIPVPALLPEALRLKGAGNYKLWKFAIIALLEQNCLLDRLEAGPEVNRCLPLPEKPTDPEIAAKDAGARLAIFLNISEYHQILVADYKTASRVWDSLVRQYESQPKSIKAGTH